ncbi:M48 family metalloprotease [Pararhizobium haloflavum]|uniref:M48 family metalloprotease n=1 Tax=Pararhizobium haloflavum TaxID=2037914 RepID=UPI000C19C91C|nr:M48 family metalloprotease [Pararhizobium haloflavum]
MTTLTIRSMRLIAAVAIAISSFFAAQPPALAQGTIAIVRDAEIEALLRDYAEPIFAAAGLTRQNIEIVLVNNRSFNAFVDGRRIFINTGALEQAETPGEIIGVIAHEAGHIAGGHQQRLREQIARAQIFGVVGSLLGVGAIAAGTLTQSDGAASAGMGVAAASGGIAQRTLLSYRRSEEMNADQAAIRYLNATSQSAAGMLRTFQRFSQGLALTGVQVNPYEQSHPMPRERIAMLEELARQSPHFNAPTSATLQMRHDLMRGKIAANTGGGQAVQRAFAGNPGSLGARYGDAIATHIRGNPADALRKINALVAEQPSNPYFHEIRGEILLEGRQPREAAQAFDRAAALAPGDASLIRAQRGFALLRSGDPSLLDQSIADLRAAISSDPTNLNAYRHLSQAYGQAGDIGNAELAMAEGHFRAGNVRDAKVFAVRAQQKLQPGTPGWVRANDILSLGQ